METLVTATEQAQDDFALVPVLTDENINEEKAVSIGENLYDADANQAVKFDIDDDFEVIHHYTPLFDERYAEYDAAAKLKFTDNGTNLLPDNRKALVRLFDDIVFDIEGYEGEMPDNWKDEIDADKEKIPSIVNFLAVAVFSDTKKVWGQTESVVFTEAYFNGKITQQKHFLRKKTIDDVRAFGKFQKIPLGTKAKGLAGGDIAMPATAAGKAVLYDKMQVKEPTGYGRRVPMWHKASVIDHIFSSGLTQKK